MYGTGVDEASTERLQRQRTLAMLPIAEQIRWLEMVDATEQRLTDNTIAMKTTGTVSD
jgi:hypothetical protein